MTKVTTAEVQPALLSTRSLSHIQRLTQQLNKLHRELDRMTINNQYAVMTEYERQTFERISLAFNDFQQQLTNLEHAHDESVTKLCEPAAPYGWTHVEGGIAI